MKIAVVLALSAMVFAQYVMSEDTVKWRNAGAGMGFNMSAKIGRVRGGSESIPMQPGAEQAQQWEIRDAMWQENADATTDEPVTDEMGLIIDAPTIGGVAKHCFWGAIFLTAYLHFAFFILGKKRAAMRQENEDTAVAPVTDEEGYVISAPSLGGVAEHRFWGAIFLTVYLHFAFFILGWWSYCY